MRCSRSGPTLPSSTCAPDMARFRPQTLDAAPGLGGPAFPSAAHSGGARPIDPSTVRDLAAEVMRAGHFFVGGGKALTVEYEPAHEVPWEVFQGRLLEPAQTRQRRTFEVWH